MLGSVEPGGAVLPPGPATRFVASSREEDKNLDGMEIWMHGGVNVRGGLCQLKGWTTFLILDEVTKLDENLHF